MKNTIQHYLKKLETQHNITILHACETGSRAWGFASTDSDYDVRVIYMHSHDWYLSLNEHKDSINVMLDNDLVDISGWDLRKSLRLLAKSNAPLIERLQSPIMYMQNESVMQQMSELAIECYSRISSIHHYHGLAKKAFAELIRTNEIDNRYKLKRLFYALGAVCVCRWIIQYDTIPDIAFAPAYQHTGLPQHIIERIDELIEFKSTVDEGYWHTGDAEILAFIAKTIEDIEKQRLTLPHQRPHWERLDSFFATMVNTHG